jgi:moderate conductance mechanosensitive channel
MKENFIINILENKLFLSALVLLIAFLITRTLEKIIYRSIIIFAKEKTRSSIRKNRLIKSYCNIFAGVLKYIVFIGGFFVILSIYQVALVNILASAGFIGVLITYIFQDIIKDITNGFFLLFQAPIKIGNRVKINNFVGVVKEIESRYIVLVDVSDNLCIINNRNIDQVTILNKDIKFKK